MSETAPPGLGLLLERWFERLDDAGYRVGVRERLLVQAHLAQRAAAGQLPADVQAVLAGVAPLLCTSPASQAQYGVLLDRFLLDAAGGPTAPRTGGRRDGARPLLRRWPAWGAIVGLLALVVALVWWASRPAPLPVPLPPPVVTTAPPPPPPAASAAGVYLIPQPLPLQPALQVQPPWAAPLRSALVGSAVLVLLGLAWAAWQRLRRQAVLAQARTTAQIDEHVLQAGARVPLAPHPALARSVVRSLRQRVAGDVQVLDTAATLNATIRAAGALSPRWRSQSRTPEYLVLVDRRHPRDHAARHELDVIAALADAGLAAHVWHYEGSPEHGCWPARARERQPLRTPFGELAARHVGQRLLVWGDTAALLDAASGAPQPWTRALPLLGERAWLTPVPLNAWGAAEDAVDAAGFLLLPAQAGALPTLAGWLTSERAELSVPPGWPLAHPVMLRDQPVEWVSRGTAPPTDEFDALMFQLRGALGTQRFQWLCGCAIFPALSPTLTLALGREALGIDGDDLVAGYTALAALPWFSYGRMPDWLRERLLDQIEPEHQAGLRRVIDGRLDQALKATPGDEMASVATERRRAWLRQAEGAAQDVLLARFLDDAEASRLMQRLPRALQRALFRDGLPLRGLRPGAWALPLLLLLPGLWAASPWWPGFGRSQPQPALAALATPINPAGAGQVNGGDAIAFSPDGSLIAGNGRGLAAPNLQVWDARTGEATRLTDPLVTPVIKTETLHPLGTHRARIDAQGRVEVVDAQGARVGDLVTAAGTRALSLDFSPDGLRLTVRMDDYSVRLYGAEWLPRLEQVGCEGTLPSVEATIVAREQADLVVANILERYEVVSYTDTTWRTLRGTAPPPGGTLRFPPGQDDAAQRLRAITVLGIKAVERVDSLDRTFVLRQCDRPPARYPPPLPAIFGLGLSEISLIDARVAELFSGSDATKRRAAADQLIRDPDVFSDAVPLALNRAAALMQGEPPAGVNAADGIYNALILANAAWPYTLLRESPALVGMSLGIMRQDDRTRQLLADVSARPSTRPLVYVQIASEDQRALATQAVALLRQRGLNAPGIELVPKAPASTELRAQGRSDRRLARETAQALATLLGTTPAVRGIAPGAKVTSDTYELWLDAGLCVLPQRRPAGCGAVRNAVAAPSANATANVPVTAPVNAPNNAGSEAPPANVNVTPAQAPAPQQQQPVQNMQQQAPQPAPNVAPPQTQAPLNNTGADTTGVPVRVVACAPAIRMIVAREVNAAADEAEAIAQRYGYRTQRQTANVQAEGFSTTRGRGLTIRYTPGTVGPLLAARQLAADAGLRALGFGDPQPDSDAPSSTTERIAAGAVTLAVCGLPNRTDVKSSK